jgi:hypothetical protein
MIKLTCSVAAWNSPGFTDTLRNELTSLGGEALPLQQGLKSSSYALDEKLSVTILNVAETAEHIIANAGLFYTGIIAGCSCADDPTPVDENTEYCEVVVRIEKATSAASIMLVD